MALKVGQGDEYVGIHDSTADLGLFYELAAFNRHLCLVIAFQAVSNDDMASGLEGVKAVFIRRIHMIQRIFAAAYIQGVAVGQESFPAAFFYHIDNDLGIVRAQIRQVARFTEVDFDGSKFVLKIDVVETGTLDQASQLFGRLRPSTVWKSEKYTLDFSILFHPFQIGLKIIAGKAQRLPY